MVLIMFFILGWLSSNLCSHFIVKQRFQIYLWSWIFVLTFFMTAGSS